MKKPILLIVVILLIAGSSGAQITPFSDSGSYLVKFDDSEYPSYGDPYTDLFIQSRIDASRNDLDLIVLVTGQRSRLLHVTVDDSLVQLFVFNNETYVPVATREWISTDHRLEQLKGYYQSYLDSGMHADAYSIGIYQHEQLHFRMLAEGVQNDGMNIRGIPALAAFFKEMSVYEP